MATIAHNSSITYAAIPNPNYVADSDIPRYAAIRFCNCLPKNEVQKLQRQVKELKDIRSTASIFCRAR